MTSRADIEKIKKKRYEALAPILIENLESRQYEAYYVDNGEEAVKKALSLMPAKSSVSWGGSATIEEIGLLDKVKSGPYKVLDRSEASTPEEKEDMLRRALSVDFYLTSFNGVSMDGIVFNIDGTGNRVAAITFGPRNVIAVVGMNKVCKDQEQALARAEDIAAQMNAARFGMEDTLFTDGDVTDDCKAPKSIWNFIEQIVFCGKPKRIKVILVGEDLGF